MPPRPYMLMEANYRQLLDSPPNVAVLPWGATEAHNYHLPHGTDVVEASAIAERAAAIASDRDARPIVLPTIPFGANAQQLYQAATIHISSATAAALLRDVAGSLKRQGIDRLVIVNAHGGNDFKPIVRDLQDELKMLLVVLNFWQMAPERSAEIFDDPGDHAGQMETAVMLALTPGWVQMEQAGPGASVPFALRSLKQAGAWTPRPWDRTQPDTGAGDPRGATAAQGEAYTAAVAEAVADILCELSAAQAGDLPYVGE